MKRPCTSFFFLLFALVGSGTNILRIEAQETPTDRAPAESKPVAGEPQTDHPKGGHPQAVRSDHPVLIAVMSPTEGNKTRGLVTFEALASGKVRVTASFTGLKSEGRHAMHIHEFGDISAPDGTSAGDHFNPAGTEHGLPGSEVRHPGDFGNLEADPEGQANLVMELEDLSLAGEADSIVGRALIVHAGEDKGTQPSGDAGDRIAQGVIAIANPASIQAKVATTGFGITPDVRATPASSAGAELERAAEKIGRGAEKALRNTARAVEEGVEAIGEGLEKAGDKIEKADVEQRRR